MSISNSYPTQRPSLNLDFANSGKLDSRLSYSRSSGGTYMSSEKSLNSENLLLQSQAFDTTWTQVGLSSRSGGNADPAGGTTAHRVVEDSSSATHRVYQVVSSTGKTSLTVYAKQAVGTRYLALKVSTGAGGPYDWVVATYDLAGGTPAMTTGTGATSIVKTSTQTLSGGSFYKCTLTVESSGGSVDVSMSSSATPSPANYGHVEYAGDGASAIDVAFSSLNTTGATDYNATTSQIHREFAPTLKTSAANAPRFEYNPITGNAEGLLVESQATNEATYSEDFTNATYNKYRATIESASAIAPDGTLTASFLREDATASNTHYLNAVTATGLSVGTTQYAVSVFVKAAGRSKIKIYDNNQNTSGSTTFDLSSGTVVTGDGSIQSCGNGWFRCTIIPTCNYSATSSVYMLLDNGSGTSYTGNSYSGILVWGYQLETGVSASSSYIKSNSGSNTTRSADSCSIAVSEISGFADAEGTLVAEGNFNNPSASSAAATLQDAAHTEYAKITTGSADSVNGYVRASGADQAVANAGSVSGDNAFKVAFRYDENNVGVSLNGGTAVTDTSATMPIGMTTLYIGRSTKTWDVLNGNLKRVAYYAAALSDTELKSLTSS